MVSLPPSAAPGSSTVATATMTSPPRAPAALAPALVTVRFGEFLRERRLIDDEQWLAALAAHWSAGLSGPRRRFGDTLVELGVLPCEVVERAAEVFHDGLDVVEVSLPLPRPRPRLPAQDPLPTLP